ncbi:hypothetical protein RZS08_40995, partial [Arthrospira platensis SPKY1]|nr:hypothetical protein [Arthrospira platensis SPKY1]
ALDIGSVLAARFDNLLNWQGITSVEDLVFELVSNNLVSLTDLEFVEGTGRLTLPIRISGAVTIPEVDLGFRTGRDDFSLIGEGTLSGTGTYNVELDLVFAASGRTTAEGRPADETGFELLVDRFVVGGSV